MRCVSDLHLEFGPFTLPVMEDEQDCVLLAVGDIDVGARTAQFLNKMAKRFRVVAYVYGNHEFYGGNICTIPLKIKQALKHNNIVILNDSTFELDDVVFIGGTLWTNYDNGNPVSMLCAQRGINDYHLIEINDEVTGKPRRITPADLVKRFNHTFAFICDQLKAKTELGDNRKVVVVTHHCPSFRSVHPRHRNSSLNGAFSSEIIEKVLTFGHVDLWVHGHTHDTFDYYVGETRVMCNPRGYVGHETNPLFDYWLTHQV